MMLVMAEQSRATFASPALALWAQREALEDARERLEKLYAAVGRAGDLALFQWAQLFTFALAFEPDLILELGRYRGNSTCVFTEVARSHNSEMRVLSLDVSDEWDRITRPKLESAVEPAWFGSLDARRADILTFDFKTALAGSERVFVFWDAHGFDVAECVLGEILPLIVDRRHLVVMHDMSDTRYTPVRAADYSDSGLWKGGNNRPGRRVRLGHIDSAVEQAVAITDFAQRNRLELRSADHSLNTELNAEQLEELSARLGPEFMSLEAHWLWFSLHGRSVDDYTFPRFTPPRPSSLRARVTAAARVLRDRRVHE